MTRFKTTQRSERSGFRSTHSALLAFAIAALTLFVTASPALASKQVVDFFGGGGTLGGQFADAAGVAVNGTGAGGVPVGTVYVTDGGSFDNSTERGNRVQRFQREDNGTPAISADDTYRFVSTWGAGVLSGGSNYEICAAAANCRAGAGDGGNGTLAGNGSLNKPGGIAIDQDTGDVYVADTSSRRTPDNNFRINVYSATGDFLRSFGWDVVESGPDDNGTGYEICNADADICKSGLPGPGAGQIGAKSDGEDAADAIAVSPPDGNPATGVVFVADMFNRRVNTYNFNGTSPSSFGSSATFGERAPGNVAVDSRGIVYVSNTRSGGKIERYDSQNANGAGVGFLAPIGAPANESQEINANATAGQFRLTFEGKVTGDLDFNAAGATIRQALEALSTVGPGNVVVQGGPNSGSPPGRYTVTFQGTLANTNLPQLVISNGTIPLSGGSGATVATSDDGGDGPLISASGVRRLLAVDPDSDTLYAFGSGPIQQFGPTNAPGLTSPPSGVDETHATSTVLSQPASLAIDQSIGRIYAGGGGLVNGTNEHGGVFVLDDANAAPPTATLDSLSGKTTHSVIAHVTINPNGLPDTSYHFEYSVDGTNWASTPTVVLGHQESPQVIEALIDPPLFGLRPNTFYHVRLVYQRRFTAALTTPELTFTTDSAPPLVETTGTPIRTTTTAQLGGRVDPNDSATTYHFEYGSEGPCATSPCVATPDKPAGSGDSFELAAEGVESLQPSTTYHYRIVADNGVGGSPVYGEDATVTTRVSDAPLSHGHFPGPPGSDRAWEQVSVADSSGNPVAITQALADDGNAAVYSVSGGTPIANSGSLLSFYYAERPAGVHPTSGWQTRLITPARDQLSGASWLGLNGRDDLATLIAPNYANSPNEGTIWRLNAAGQPLKLFEPAPPRQLVTLFGNSATGISADGSRVVVTAKGGELDPAYPAATAVPNFYDISSGGIPQLLSLLPGDVPADCGVGAAAGALSAVGGQASHWVSADGSRVFFSTQGGAPCVGAFELYVRDFDAGETKPVSGSPVSGPTCNANFVKATPGAAFFTTTSRLVPEDSVPNSCVSSSNQDNDVYRYDLGDGSLKCLTCVQPGVSTDVEGWGVAEIAVSEDGSRLYFRAGTRLLPGAKNPAVYRIDVASGDLAYVAPLVNIGSSLSTAGLNPDGSVLVFQSGSPALNPLGGASDNGGKAQYYRYDDTDRSLVCTSCPSDGAAATGGVDSLVVGGYEGQPNLTALSDDGATLAFVTPTSLAGADQNAPTTGGDVAAGKDVYEWRDGRVLLVTDGLTSWSYYPIMTGVSASGRDIFFSVPAQYTADALDDNNRLYDARIGGGMEFPAAQPPCPLEVCQGTPKGAPEEPPPGTSNFAGTGNAKQPTGRKCPKGKARRKGRCIARHPGKKHRNKSKHSRANHDRRNAR